MLVCDYIGSNYPGGKRTKRDFFALWPRQQSDGVTHEIIKRLGFGDSCRYRSGTHVPDLYATFLALPTLDLPTSSLPLRQAHALFQKNGDMVSPIDKEAVAWSSFQQSERDCKLINDKFAARSFTWAEASILGSASRYVSCVLGNCPSIDELEPTFGPGASVTDVTSTYTSPQWKLAGSTVVSNSLLRLSEELRASFPSWLGGANLIPATGRLEFVPKSFKTDRSIMIEPLVNAFLQKGVGSLLKKRLKAKGIDLSDQSIQRDRARVGSIDETFSTIDLSRASDSIAYALVMELLPLPWFDLLDSLRTGEVTYKKKLIVLEKFSSMGNGFTFELETLVFKSIIHGIAEFHAVEDNSVCYGDDITCSPELGLLIEEYFPSFGFTVNRDKSFLSGPFREACGGDYLKGVDVRPFYLKSLRDGGRWTSAKLVSFHNFLKRKPWFDSDGLSDFILSVIPRNHVVWGPDGYGDGHCISYSSPSTYLQRVDRYSEKGKRRKPWNEGYEFSSFIARPCIVPGPVNDELLPSYAAYAGLSRDNVYARDVVRLPKGDFQPSKLATITTSPVGYSSKDENLKTLVDLWLVAN